jgi:hypothetical protein
MSPFFVFLRDVWIRTQSAAVASRRATNLATHLPIKLPTSLLSHPFPLVILFIVCAIGSKAYSLHHSLILSYTHRDPLQIGSTNIFFS